MSLFEIDNRDQIHYLNLNGFTLYPHTYSVGANTINSMSSVLEVATSWTGGVRKAVSGQGNVQNQFKRLGYQTYGIFASDFMFRGTKSYYDVTIPDEDAPIDNLLVIAVLIGEFRFNLGFEDQDHVQFLVKKQETLSSIGSDPSFVYMHTNLPGHSQISGKCLPNERELYIERLGKANQEMRDDIQLITERDPNAIVIIASDHGPYLTKNCVGTGNSYDISEINRLDIQDRFGTMLAIRWPDGIDKPYEQITVLQDIFPAVFAVIFRDESILDIKIPPVMISSSAVSGVVVKNGIIIGGMDDGEPLFLSEE
jgi:hypothetical protein